MLSNKESFQDKVFDIEEEVSKYNPKITFSTKSKYQNIEIIEFDKNNYGMDKCLLLNDEIQLCNENEHIYHELIVHFVASYMKSIKNVLIVGGGDCMTLREVMKYPSIQNVTMLELDKEVINVSKQIFNVNDYQNDPRVNIIIDDATNSIKDVKNNMYDLVIIDTTEDSSNNSPIDSYKFYSSCKSKLTSNGIMIKNGNSIRNYDYLGKLFTNTEIIKYDIKIFGEDDYKFMICSDIIDFKKSKKYHHDIHFKYYDLSNHESFFLI
jgi:spermidine synthase